MKRLTSNRKQPDYLVHHGVKGMKWGVRKSRPSSGGSRRSSGKSSSGPSKFSGAGSTAKKKSRIRSMAVSIKQRFRSGKSSQNGSKTSKSAPQKKSVKDMSDNELNRRINRMEKERRYKELDHQLNPQKTSFGKKFIDEAIKPAITQAARTTMTNALTKTGEKYVNQLFPKEQSALQKLQSKNALLQARKTNIELDAWIKKYEKTGKIS